MFLWGFFFERVLIFEIDFCMWLFCVKGLFFVSNMDVEKDQWGVVYIFEIKIVGWIILNVWRFMRYEV